MRTLVSVMASMEPSGPAAPSRKGALAAHAAGCGPTASVAAGGVAGRRHAPTARDGTPPPSYAAAGAGALCVVVDCAASGRRFVLTARPGPGGVGAVDEHYAVDADDRANRHRLGAADVLVGGRVRALGEAVRWLAGTAAAYPGCRLAAVPLAEGGWAVVGGAGREVALLPCRVPADRSLFPSCLHAWLVAGGSLPDLARAEITVARPPAPAVSGPAVPPPGRSAGRRRPDW